MRQWQCLARTLIAGAALIAPAGRALAYSDLFRFNDTALGGGGGGRWFSGSPTDGYTCDVCHVGPVAEPLSVRGLPDAYIPGATYDVQVSWPAFVAGVVAVVEITDAVGRGAGKAVVPQPLSAAELCQPAADGVPAALVLEGDELGLPDARQVTGLQDCGASVLHWQWTAPATDVGPLLFAGGVVMPDGLDDAAGDRATRLFKSIGSPGQPDYEQQLRGGCAALGVGHLPIGLGCAYAIALLWRALVVRARARRRDRACARRQCSLSEH